MGPKWRERGREPKMAWDQVGLAVCPHPDARQDKRLA